MRRMSCASYAFAKSGASRWSSATARAPIAGSQSRTACAGTLPHACAWSSCLATPPTPTRTGHLELPHARQAGPCILRRINICKGQWFVVTTSVGSGRKRSFRSMAVGCALIVLRVVRATRVPQCARFLHRLQDVQDVIGDLGKQVRQPLLWVGRAHRVRAPAAAAR